MLSSMGEKITRESASAHISERLSTAFPGDDLDTIRDFVEARPRTMTWSYRHWSIADQWNAAEEALELYKIHRINPPTRGATYAGPPPTSIEVVVRSPASPDLPDVAFRRMHLRQQAWIRTIQAWRRIRQAIADRWRKLAGRAN